MNDDTPSKKAVVLPLAHNAKGDVRGLVLDETGIRGAEFRRIEEGPPIMGEYVELKGSRTVARIFRKTG